MDQAVPLQFLLVDKCLQTDRAPKGSDAEVGLAVYRQCPLQLKSPSTLVAHVSLLFYIYKKGKS